jgi:hypothetical protein
VRWPPDLHSVVRGAGPEPDHSLSREKTDVALAAFEVARASVATACMQTLLRTSRLNAALELMGYRTVHQPHHSHCQWPLSVGARLPHETSCLTAAPVRSRTGEALQGYCPCFPISWRMLYETGACSCSCAGLYWRPARGCTVNVPHQLAHAWPMKQVASQLLLRSYSKGLGLSLTASGHGLPFSLVSRDIMSASTKG